MRIVFGILGILLLISSMGTCAMSKSAIHEAVGAALLIAAAIFLVGAALLKEAQEIKQHLARPPGQQVEQIGSKIKERLRLVGA